MSGVAEMEEFFKPVPGIPNTNHFNDCALAFALHDTINGCGPPRSRTRSRSRRRSLRFRSPCRPAR